MSFREELKIVGHLTFIKKVTPKESPYFYKMGLAVDRGKGKDPVYYTIKLNGKYAEWMDKMIVHLKPGRLFGASGVPDYETFPAPDGTQRIERVLYPSGIPELLDRGS